MAFYIPARRHRVTPVPVGHATAPNQELRRRDLHPLVQQPDSLHGLPGSLAVHLQLCNVPATPDGPSRLAMAAFPVLPPLALKRRRHHLAISRLNSVASLPAVYASRRTLPCAMQHALPAGWLAFAGREFHPLDRDVGFQFRLTSLHPPIQSLAWRKVLQSMLLPPCPAPAATNRKRQLLSGVRTHKEDAPFTAHWVFRLAQIDFLNLIWHQYSLPLNRNFMTRFEKLSNDIRQVSDIRLDSYWEQSWSDQSPSVEMPGPAAASVPTSAESDTPAGPVWPPRSASAWPDRREAS